MWKAHRPVTWYSSDDSVATVYNGKVEGKSAGEARIFAKTSTGVSASYTVIVYERYLS